MHTHRYDEYVDGYEDDDIYQEVIEVDQNFTVSDRVCLAELDTSDVELLDEEAGPSKNHLRKSNHLLERQEICERLDTCATEADSDADNF
jgi:hypothetical protein